jgi:Dual specificity phosphatase, catalytic domain
MNNHSRYSEIEPGLWIGACPQGKAPDFATAILNLFGREQYDHDCEAYREERLLDLDVPDRALLDSLALWVHEQRERDLTVLVHCEEGRNRSALVLALYLIRHRGMRASAAIDLIREKRTSALYNGGFVRYLKSLDAPERVRIVDVGETAGARFLVYHDDDEEPTSAHGSLRAAEAWVDVVRRFHGDALIAVTHEEAHQSPL